MKMTNEDLEKKEIEKKVMEEIYKQIEEAIKNKESKGKRK